MTAEQGEMRFYPHGRTIVARTGRELAEAGVFVHPNAVAEALGEENRTQYEAALIEQRARKQA